MTRTDFESLPSKVQRQIAERELRAVSRMMFQELYDQGIYTDELGRMSEVHHLLARSHCPLWYVFQRENLRVVSQPLHYALHFKPRSGMTQIEAEYYDEFKRIAEQLKQEEPI